MMKFEELTEERQDNIVETNCEINVDYDWYGYSLEDIAETIKEKVGVELKCNDLMFDFFSKGNSGLWVDRDVLTSALREKYPKLEELDVGNDFGVWAYIGLRRDDTDGDIYFYEEDEYDGLAKLMMDKQDDQDKEKIREDLDVVLDEFADGYNSLYEEYSYLTSDDGIIETIKANEMEFEDED